MKKWDSVFRVSAPDKSAGREYDFSKSKVKDLSQITYVA